MREVRELQAKSERDKLREEEEEEILSSFHPAIEPTASAVAFDDDGSTQQAIVIFSLFFVVSLGFDRVVFSASDFLFLFVCCRNLR